MRLFTTLLLLCFFITSCKTPKTPNVDNIQVDLKLQRFEKDIFKIDSTNALVELDSILSKYPSFGNFYLGHILNADPKWDADSIARYVYQFTQFYKTVYDSSEQVFKDFSPYEKDIKKGLQYVKYYFPKYKTPHTIITYVGPLDGYGDILDEELGEIYIGLHAHLGKDYSLYKTAWIQETYPDYISRRFEPEYIPITVLSRIVAELYPENSEDRSLIVQMVEKGKRLYLLNKFLPTTPEYRLIGYTEAQMKDSYAHEQQIWALFIQNNLLQNSEYNTTKNYIGESPKTAELGEASPGNIGAFVGWQIVKKYMDKNPNTELRIMMEMDPEKLYEASKYKP